MIKEGDRVFILPTNSLAFAGKWGVVERIVQNDELPFKVRFDDSTNTFGFDRNSFLTEVDYWYWLYDDCLLQNGEIIQVKYKEYPYIISQSGEHIHFSELVPVTTCYKCGKDTTGEFSNLCQDCAYPVPVGD